MFVSVLEMIGTVSFAVSGVVTGMRKNLDLFGACILGIITAVGGGAIRDIVLGITPPTVFRDPAYAVLALCVSLIFLISPIRKSLKKNAKLYESVLFIMDSIGLGIFTVIGVSVAMNGYSEYGLMLNIFVGVITGVGGGMMRDVLSGDVPYIFVKHIYALASIAGSIVCTFMWSAGMMAAMGCGAATTILIRCLSAKFGWNLPHISDNIPE